MKMRVVIGVGSVALAVLVTVLLMRALSTQSPDLQHPVRMRSLDAEFFYVDAVDIVRRGPSRVVVLRFDQPVELVPHHYNHDGLSEPQTVEEWGQRLNAPIVFNAGQFDENLRHLGWLKADGEWLMKHRKEQWLGLLLSGPTDGAAEVRIADLKHADAAIADRYRHVVQSMMLVDDQEDVRVRSSDKAACRTVVAEDTRGRILVLLTEGAVTLSDMAQWLPKTGLNIVRAMNLDGGIESQLFINTAELQLAIYGQFGTGTTTLEAGAGPIRYPLPTVIAVRPLAAGTE